MLGSNPKLCPYNTSSWRALSNWRLKDTNQTIRVNGKEDTIILTIRHTICIYSAAIRLYLAYRLFDGDDVIMLEIIVRKRKSENKDSTKHTVLGRKDRLITFSTMPDSSVSSDSLSASIP